MDEDVKRFYEEEGQRTQFTEYQTPAIKRYMQEEAAAIIAHLSPDMRVLEAGCGTGRVIGLLRDALPGLSISAIDFSGDVARATAERFQDVEVLHANAASLPLEWDGVFDAVVFAFNTFGNLEDAAAPALTEAKRALKHGGKILVSVYSEHALQAQLELYRRAQWEVDAVEDHLVRIRNGNGSGMVSRRFTQQMLKAELGGDFNYEVTIYPLTKIGWLLVAESKATVVSGEEKGRAPSALELDGGLL